MCKYPWSTASYFLDISVKSPFDGWSTRRTCNGSTTCQAARRRSRGVATRSLLIDDKKEGSQQRCEDTMVDEEVLWWTN